jgi:hypothetical protein
MIDTESQIKGIRIEKYLRILLKVKEGSKADTELNRFYDGLINMENGRVDFIKPSERKKIYKKDLKYFSKGLDIIEKRIGQHSEINLMKYQIESMDDTESMYDLYQRMEKLYNPK